MLFNEAMRLERDAYLGAGPWERSEDRRGWANNLKPKTLKSRVGDLELRVPKARGLDDGLEPLHPQSLERGSRIEQALGLALAEMYVQGVSTRKVKEITEQLCGREISSSQVSRLAAQLDEVLEGWRTRKLGSVRYLAPAARYVKVRRGGSVLDFAVLIAAGVRADGKRTILGCSVSFRKPRSTGAAFWRASSTEGSTASSSSPAMTMRASRPR